jgi:hypothetical protein
MTPYTKMGKDYFNIGLGLINENNPLFVKDIIEKTIKTKEQILQEQLQKQNKQEEAE